MADLHLLFADRLAQAIAEARKTVTRRPITKQNSNISDGRFEDLDFDAHLVATRGRPAPTGASPCSWRCDGRTFCFMTIEGTADRLGEYLQVPSLAGSHVRRVCAKRKPGDLLIVRECWALVTGAKIEYRAETSAAVPGSCGDLPKDERPDSARWNPSVHMPRWAARSIRRITSIRPDLVGVAPLSQTEAEREGFASPAEFFAAWASIYGDKPRWAWRYEFEGNNAI